MKNNMFIKKIVLKDYLNKRYILIVLKCIYLNYLSYVVDMVIIWFENEKNYEIAIIIDSEFGFNLIIIVK